MDLSNMSSADLRNLQEQVKRELKQREGQDLAKAREQILAIAQSVGVPLKDLVGGAGVGAVRGGRKTGTVAPRYRNPADQSQQWTGRGRQPKWVKEWVEGGKSLDKLRDIATLKIIGAGSAGLLGMFGSSRAQAHPEERPAYAKGLPPLKIKNIKAIAVRGTRRPEWAHPRELTAISKDLSRRSFGPATAKYRELGTAANLLTLTPSHMESRWFAESRRLQLRRYTGGAASEHH